MKPRTQIIWVGALLLGVAALSSMKRGARSDSTGRNRGACCPFMAAPDAMPMPPGTNRTMLDFNTNTHDIHTNVPLP